MTGMRSAERVTDQFTFTEGQRVRVRREVARMLRQPLRKWVRAGRPATVIEVGALVVVQFDRARKPKSHLEDIYRSEFYASELEAIR